MKPDDRSLVEQAKRILNAAVDDLDPRTQAALQRARREALAAASPHRRWQPLWIGGAVTAATVLLAVLLWSALRPNGKPGLGLEEMDALVTLEAVEIVDDLEFYEWLAKTDRAS